MGTVWGSHSCTPGWRAGDPDEAGSSGKEKRVDVASVWEAGLAELAARMDGGV